MKFNQKQKAKLREAIQKEVKKSACSTQDAIRLRMLKVALKQNDFDDDPACYSVAEAYRII